MEERLQKYMARCGVASRRKCEELILEGKVKVDGKIVTELGTKVSEGKNLIEINNKEIKPEADKVYIMLNKPVGYLSSVTDDRGRKTIVDLVKVKERIYPIGRLDYDTSGLILLTNDGEVYNKVIHPRVEIDKVYVAEIEGKPTLETIESFERGIDIGDYITAPGNLRIIKTFSNKSKVAITIHEGRNRQVRRMCAAVNHPVITLKRISIGSLSLDSSLKEGQWRYLKEDEIEYLKRGCVSHV